jgi:hypothetical protein
MLAQRRCRLGLLMVFNGSGQVFCNCESGTGSGTDARAAATAELIIIAELKAAGIT